MLKKIFLCILVIAVICSSTVTGFAADKLDIAEKPIGVGTRMTYISYISTKLTISSYGLASCWSRIIAYPGTDSVRISMYLQKYDNGWKTVKHWAQNYNDYMGLLTKEWFIVSGSYYRVKTYYYAYEGSDYECVTGSYGSIWY